MATTARWIAAALLTLALVLGTGGCSALLDVDSLTGGKLDTGRDTSPDHRKIDARIDRRVVVELRVDRTPPTPDVQPDKIVIPEGKVLDKTVIPEGKVPDKTVVPEGPTPDAKLPDAAKPDATKPDAALPDAPKPEAALPDAPAGQ